MPWFLPSLVLSLLLPLLAPAPAFAATDGPSAAAGARWRLPVAGATVTGGFSYDRAHPFRAGRRRGVDLDVWPGAAVRSACPGRVTYAGPVPWGGRGVSVRCGPLVATHLGLGRTVVRRGDLVPAGRSLGVAGPRGTVRLGARRAADRWGWVDPLPLLGRVRGPVPPAPAIRVRRAPRAPTAPFPVAAMRRPIAAHLPRPSPLPLTVLLWTAVVLLALGLGVHGRLWRSRPGRAARTALGLSRAPR